MKINSQKSQKNSIVSKGRLSNIYKSYEKFTAIPIKVERLYKLECFVNEAMVEANLI